MHASTNANGPVRLRDLGFGTSWITVLLLTSATLPTIAAFALGATSLLALCIGLASVMALSGAAQLALRRLRSHLLAPLQDAARAMEHLRTSGQAQRLDERGASLLQPLLRRFNQALLAIEQRDHASKCNLTNVEVAFDRVHAVLQSLRECVIVIDPRGRVVLCNLAAHQMLGTETRTDGLELLPLLNGDLEKAVRDGVAQIETGTTGEVRASDLHHQRHIYDLAIVQVKSNRPDQDFGKVIVLADVTRNHEINRIKDELLSSISHELRTPLTNMCSSSEILTSLTIEDEAAWREFTAILHGESRRLKILVDDVMEYTAIETQKIHWQIEQVNVVAVAQKSVELLRGKALDKQLDLQLAAAPHVQHALAAIDRGRITEVICRLIDNAIKFTPPGGRVLVTVNTHDGLIEIAVADSGIGIAPENRQRIFERFTQLGDTLTGKPAGTGLGLSIAHRIVIAFGGQIWCEESHLGGAQLRFVLPQVSLVAR